MREPVDQWKEVTISFVPIEGGPCETKEMIKELCQRSELADVAICKFYGSRKVQVRCVDGARKPERTRMVRRARATSRHRICDGARRGRELT